MFWATLLPLLKAAGIGAAIGGGTAAATGGDVKRGALMGAAGGGATSGLTGLMGGASGAASSAAAGSTAKQGLSQLLKKAAIEQGMNTAASMATPSYGMSTPGAVPQLNSEDPMIALQQLIQRGGHY